MALDPSTGSRPRPARPEEGSRGPGNPPPKPAAAGKPDEGSRGLTPRPQPNRILQERFGFHGTVEEFNRRLEVIDKSHRDQVGYRPSGDLVYDIARSPVKDEQVPVLFQVPRTRKAAQARLFARPDAVGRWQKTDPISQKVAQSAEFGILPDAYTDEELLDDLDAALSRSRRDFKEFYVAHRDRIERLMETRGPLGARALETTQIKAAGITGDELGGRAVEYVVKATTAFAFGMASGPPILAYEEGKGVVESVKQRSLRPFLDTQKKLGEDIVRGAVQVATDPLAPENVAFAAQMFLGGAAATGGAVSRVAAAGRQVKAGRGVKAALVAPAAEGGSLLRRPAAGRTRVTYGDLEVELLNTENAGLRPIQLGVRRLREKMGNRRFRAGYQPVPAESVSAFRIVPFQKTIAKTFSWERKIGRELDKRARIERELGLLTRDELVRVTGWATEFSTKIDRLPDKVKTGLTRGEQMALMVKTLSDPDPVTTMRRFHEEKLVEGPGPWAGLYGEIDPARWQATHEARLADLKLAERLLANPAKQSARFKQALELVERADAELDLIKLRDTHLTQEIADRRVVKAADVFRTGEPFENKAALLKDLERFERAEARAGVSGEVAAGVWVRAADRDNYGRVESVDGDTATVRFANREEGTQARLSLPVSALTPASKEAKRRLDAAAEREAALPEREPGSTYMQFSSFAKRKHTPKDMFRGGRLNWLRGIGKQELRRNFPEAFHEFTGKAIVAGNYRIDASRLMAESVGRAVQGAFKMSQYADLLRSATPRPKSVWDRPILKPEADGWPDELKEILLRTDEGALTADEATLLSKQDWQALDKAMFPAERNPQTGLWEPTVPIEHVLWVDERLLSPAAFRQPLPSAPIKALELAQDVYRVPALYGKPSYAMNLISNEVMALIYQGPLAPWRYAKALFGKRLLGEETYRAFAEMVGVGRFKSYADQTTASRVARGAAHFWNRFTDQDARISTALYYAEKLGYKTDDLARLVQDAKADRKSKAFEDLLEIKERTNKAMVQLDNLTWAESAILRHIVFVYPWRRGQAVWSLRTLVEKPVKASVLGLIGKGSEEEIGDFLKDKAGEWRRKAGFLPTRYDEDGNPIVVSPATLNTWGDLASLFDPDLERSVGPVVETAVRAIDGEDEYGNEYPSQHAAGRTLYAMLDVLSGLPQFAGHRKEKPERDRGPADITDRRALISRLNALADEAVLDPGWADGWGRLITGPAFTERRLDQEVLEAKMYRDLPPEKRHEINKLLIRAQLEAQARLLEQKLPKPVREAAQLFEDRNWAEHQWQKDHVRDWTDAELTDFHINYYTDLGLLDGDDLTKTRKSAKTLATANEHRAFRRRLFGYVTDDALAKWSADVKLVAALSKPAVLNRRLAALQTDGLLSNETRKLTQAAGKLREYGRQVLTWEKRNRQWRDRLADVDDPADENLLWAEYRAWLDKTDRPVHLGGQELPSPARIQWAALKDEERRQVMYDRMTRPWPLLSSLDKTLLGRPPKPGVANGWQMFEQIKRDQLQGKRAPQGYDLQLARWINKNHADGFYAEWLFSREPLAVRLKYMTPIQRSPHRAVWNQILEYTKGGVDALKHPDYSKADVRESWQTYVRDTLAPWAQSQPGFREELEMLGGPQILYQLLN